MNKYQFVMISLALFLLILFVVFYFLDLINFTAMVFGVVNNALIVVLVMLFQRGK